MHPTQKVYQQVWQAVALDIPDSPTLDKYDSPDIPPSFPFDVPSGAAPGEQMAASKL